MRVYFGSHPPQQGSRDIRSMAVGRQRNVDAGALDFSFLFSPGPSTEPATFCLFPLKSSLSGNALMGLLGDSIASQVHKFNYHTDLTLYKK